MDARTAIHEAGHALVAMALGLPIERVTIVPDASTNTVGHVLLDRSRALGSGERPALAPEALVWVRSASLAWSVSGPLAEAIMFGEADGGSGDDYRKATAAADLMDDEAGTLEWMWRPACERAVEGYLRRHWPLVLDLAAALLDERTLAGPRVTEIVGDVPPLDLANVEGGVRHWQERMAAREHAGSTRDR